MLKYHLYDLELDEPDDDIDLDDYYERMAEAIDEAYERERDC